VQIEPKLAQIKLQINIRQSRSVIRPTVSLGNHTNSVKQISPDKSMNFPCTAASFTVAV